MTEIVKYVVENSSFLKDSDIPLTEQIRLKNWIEKTLPYVTIQSIAKIRNKHMYTAFVLKKQEFGSCTVKEVIHSTSTMNLNSTTKNNLDWRLVTRAKYGFGTSFSENADYANYHSSWSGGSSRVFLVCDILIKKKRRTVTDTKDVFPRYSDCYHSQNGHVYVKFDDFTYYPKYALYYDEQPTRMKSSFYRSTTSHNYHLEECDLYEDFHIYTSDDFY